MVRFVGDGLTSGPGWVDPDALDRAWHAAIEQAATVAGARNVADAAAVDLIADVIATDAWRGDGIRSVTHWVQWNLGLSISQAVKLVKIAERRDELDETMRLFRNGELSSDQVALIAKHAPTTFEASSGRLARELTMNQLSRVMRSYSFAEDPPTPPSHDEETDAAAAGSLSMSTTESGRFVLRVEGDAEAGNRVRTTLDQFRSKLRHELDETNRVTGFDAFMDLIDTATDHDPSRSRRDRTRVFVHLDLTKRGLIGSTHLGPTVPDELLRLITCDASTQAVIDEAGTPLALGRTSRTVPDSLRNQILHRDQGCLVCGRTRNLDAHHLHHWIDGGATDPENLITLCSACHQAHHRGEFDIQASADAPGGVVITNQHGVPWNRPPRQPPDPPDPDSPDPPPRFHKPTHEPLRTGDIHLTENPRPPHLE